MSYFENFWYYIVGALVFSFISALIVRFLNKVVVNSAVDAFTNVIDDVVKNNLKIKKEEDDKKVRDKDKEIEQETLNEFAIEDEIEQNSNPIGVESLGNGEIPKKIEKKRSKIVGIANKSSVIKGKFSQKMAEETLNSLKNVSLETLQQKGVNQARFQAQNQPNQFGGIKKSGGRGI